MQAVLMVWPAAHRGVESLVFQALLSQLHKVNVGDFLGGWVQTSTCLSPLQSMVFEEQRRQVREDCFRCGGGHYASACKRTTSNLFCTYKCKSCDATLDITSRGEDQKPAGGTAGESKTRSSDRGGSSSSSSTTVAVDRGVKRTAGQASGTPAAKTAKLPAHLPRNGLAVNVCGKRCTALSWYMNKSSPAPKFVKRLRDALRDDALELQNGDCRTLALGGFAASGLGRPLLLTDNGDARQRMTDDWLETECYAVNNGSRLRLRKASSGRTFPHRRLNQIIWSVDALNAYMGPAR